MKVKFDLSKKIVKIWRLEFNPKKHILKNKTVANWLNLARKKKPIDLLELWGKSSVCKEERNGRF
jgi:hypothetical protein